MKKILETVFVTIFMISVVFLSGCGENFLDPSQVGRFRPVPAVNVILNTLGVAEEAPVAWESGEEPKPEDVIAYDTDYVFGPGDVVRVTIFELFQEGVSAENSYIVTETGKLSIPDVGIVEAEGLTESQLEEEIKQILAPNILKDPSVVVTLLSSQQRMFSILGNGIPTPNRYEIPRYDFRLTDALSLAGGISQFNISYIYVSRQITGKEDMSNQGVMENEGFLPDTTDKKLELIAPMAGKTSDSDVLVISASDVITDKELSEVALPEGFEPLAEEATELEPIQEEAVVSERETIAEPIKAEQSGRVEWVFKDGKWVPIDVGGGETEVVGEVAKAAQKAAEPNEKEWKEGFDWESIGQGGVQVRVIRIPADKLLGGDPRYNVVIRPGDSIHVPVDIIGEFYIMGNCNFQGNINLTGRPMTLKMAIASAGGLGSLAWPKKCEVTRRIGKEKEETVMVDLDKIARGEQPDFFIKPNDLVNVGTHPTSIWRAVLRNAFRATYGFGFIYDRNFADRDYGTSRPFSFF
ncbi:MAG TPA: polysaccharide biosynthesis/export family protein [Sedimentisphaerales bacterium]|nr:polysaccharide biosynthesis/export family protein [Sedimentisphaerales bacterium]